jgi:sugar O-acyltransferase (sialic acid O-acetyltransferase NeuD family)
MKKLLIVGAGGFGREMWIWAGQVPASEREWEAHGFLDDNPDALKGFNHPARVLGKISDYQPKPDEVLTVAIGDPRAKMQVAEVLQKKGAQFTTIVHPTALIGLNVKLGRGVIICPHVCIPCDAVLGDFVHVNSNSTVAHDTVLGDYTTLSGHCDVTGSSRLGKGVFLGSHASVLPSVKVGDFAKIGAGTVAATNVQPEVTLLGVPGKRLL